jgi:hypothetical protein
MGTHEALMDRLEKLLDGGEVPFSSKLQFETGGTVNFWAMGVAGEYLRAQHFGTDAEKKKARKRAREYFDRQRKDGHMCRGFAIEQTCLDPHYNFHLVSAAVIRLAARESGHADVLDDSGEWFRWHVGLYRTCMSPRGEVFMPGLRAKGSASWQVPTTVMCEILGLKPIGPAKKPEKWKERFFAGPRIVRQLLKGGDDLGGAKTSKETPFLRLPLTVRRYEGGHVAFLGRAGADLTILEPLDWVSVRYGAEPELGRSWEHEPPVQTASLLEERRFGEQVA